MAATKLTFNYKHDASAGEIPAFVYFNTTSKVDAASLPIIMIIHGGGYVGCGAYIVPQTQINRLVEMGFVVVTPEYRLCPQVSVAEGPLADMRDCLRWIQRDLPGLLQSEAQISVDGARVGVMGHSAGGNLAMVLGAETPAPKAVLDIYGTILPSDPFYHSPTPAFQAGPDVDPAFLEQIYDGPVPISAPPMFKAGKPDIGSPRNAWMVTALKRGTQIKECVKDGNYEAISGVAHLKKGFPPTCIIHGDKDVFAPYEHSVMAVEKMKELGIVSELITVPDQDHMFELMIPAESSLFTYVQQGLDFLKKHV